MHYGRHSARSMIVADAPGAAPAFKPRSSSPAAGPFVLRIVDIGYVMAKPLPGVDECFVPLSGEAATQTPVIRIYGATPAGQKALLHLHGVRSDNYWRFYVSEVMRDTLCFTVVCIWCWWMRQLAARLKLYPGFLAADLRTIRMCFLSSAFSCCLELRWSHSRVYRSGRFLDSGGTRAA